VAAQTPRRALIIGAGPGGLTAAVALRRVGIDATVFERTSELGRAPGGLAVQSNALRALTKLGIGDHITRVGTPLRSTEIYNSRGKLILQLPVGEVTDARGAPTLAVSRGDLQIALSEAVDNGHIQLGSECTGVEQDADGVTARFADGRTERGVLVVGADGGRSVVRKHVYGDQDAPRRYSGVTAWRSVVNLKSDLLPVGAIRFYYGPARQFTLAAIDGQRAFWGFVNTEPAGGKDPPDGVRRILCDLLKDFPAITREVVEATPDDGIIRTDVYDRDPEKTWVKGRVALLGDAAHLTTPFVGEGASITMEDAVALAKELSLTGGLTDQQMLDTALESYQHVRQPRCSDIVLASRRLGRIYLSTNPALIRVRDAVMSRLPVALRRAMIERSYRDEV
jgi:2-polyprenyl-6-methoxyphenol hydroxylase-like FAD-dependent oxidoreductase